MAERVGQLTMPPTITTMRNTSEAVPITAARIPCLASGTRAATDPVVIALDYISASTGIQLIRVTANYVTGEAGTTTSGVLTQKASVEEPRLPLGFESELRVELVAEALVALDDRLPEAELRLRSHGELVGGLVVRIERQRLLGGGERIRWVAVGETIVTELLEEANDPGGKVAHVACGPGIVRARQRVAAHERERPLEELVLGRLRRRPV